MSATDTELHDLARDIATEAGDLAKRRRAEGVAVAATKSSPVDVVTETDREVEEFIRARIAAARPGDGFLGEESDARGSETGLTWVVDPIDGTVNFLYDIPAWAVSIAVVEGPPTPAEWTAVAGCVVVPPLGEVYTAVRGGGARLNGRPLAASSPDSLLESLVATGFSYRAEHRVAQATAVIDFIGSIRDLRRGGSAAVELCAVAAGRLDAFFERGLNPWDHAAGGLIAAEAGARVRVFDPDGEERPLVLAASPAIATELEDRLRRAGA